MLVWIQIPLSALLKHIKILVRGRKKPTGSLCKNSLALPLAPSMLVRFGQASVPRCTEVRPPRCAQAPGEHANAMGASPELPGVNPASVFRRPKPFPHSEPNVVPQHKGPPSGSTGSANLCYFLIGTFFSAPKVTFRKIF